MVAFTVLHVRRGSNYRTAGNFRMVQIFVIFECTFRMRKSELAKIYITRGKISFWLIIRKFAPTKNSRYTINKADCTLVAGTVGKLQNPSNQRRPRAAYYPPYVQTPLILFLTVSCTFFPLAQMAGNSIITLD